MSTHPAPAASDLAPPATPHVLALVAQHMPPRYAAAVHLAAWAHVTCAELFALTRSQADPFGALLIVDGDQDEPHDPRDPPPPARASGHPPRRRYTRAVELPPLVASVLEHHMRTYGPTSPAAPLFAHPTGHPLAPPTRRRLLADASRAAGLAPLRWHDLRQYPTLRPLAPLVNGDHTR